MWLSLVERSLAKLGGSGRRSRKFVSVREQKIEDEVWLSLVERYVRDVEVASSNLVTSTILALRSVSRSLFLV